MGDPDTAMQRWCDEALVVIGSLLDLAPPGTGAAVDEDGLRDAVHHAERWTAMHPCPDSKLGEELAHLVDGWSSVTGSDEGAPDGAERLVGADERRQQIRELTGDTVRLQAEVEAELLPGQ
jgi:hypothetical protein